MNKSKVSKVKNLAKDTGLFAISSFGSKLLLFFLTPLYTSVLSTSQYGVADLINTTVSFIYPVLTLSIAESALRFSMDKSVSQRDVINNTLLVTVLSFALVWISKPLICLIDISLDKYWLYFFIIFCLNNIQIAVSNYVKGIGKTTLFAVSGILQTIVIIVSNILFLLMFRFELDGYLWSIIIGYGVTNLVLFFGGKLYSYLLPIRLNRILLQEMLIYSIPMIPTLIAWATNTSIDKYMIINLVGMSSNGIYSVAHKIPTILTTVLMIFLNAWQLSAISNHGEEDESDFQTDIYNVFNIVGLIGCFVLIIFNKPLAKLLFANDFYEAWHYVPFLISSSFFSALAGFLAAAFRASKKTKGLFISVLIGAVINIALNYILINSIGTLGAAIATGISFFFVWISRYVMVQKIIKIRIDVLKTIITYGLFFLSVVVESLGIGTSIYCSIVSFLIVVFIYRKDIKRIFLLLFSVVIRRKQ